MGELIAAGVKSALRFWWPAVRGAWPWLILISAINVIPTANREVALGVTFISGLVGAAATARLYSVAFDKGRSANPFARVLASDLLLGLFLFVIAILAAVVCLAFVFGSAWAATNGKLGDLDTLGSVTGPREHALIYIVCALNLVALTWVYLRVSLNAAASVAEDRVAMLSTWSYTRGRVIPMLVVRSLIFIVIFGLAVLVIIVLDAIPKSATARSHASSVVVGVLFAFLWLPLQIGAGAEFYRRRILPPEPAP